MKKREREYGSSEYTGRDGRSSRKEKKRMGGGRAAWKGKNGRIVKLKKKTKKQEKKNTHTREKREHERAGVAM